MIAYVSSFRFCRLYREHRENSEKNNNRGMTLSGPMTLMIREAEKESENEKGRLFTRRRALRLALARCHNQSRRRYLTVGQLFG